MTTTARMLGGFAAAACTFLVAGSLARPANASTCTGMPGSPFELGITNSCNNTTTLSGSASPELSVSSSAVGGTAVYANATAGTGLSTGVWGQTFSSGQQAVAVYGLLSTGAAGSSSAGVQGESNSQTANGYGVWGLHTAGTGTAPGVYGSTQSTTADAAGVYGTISSSAANAAGVRGYNASASCCGMGVAGFHAGQGIGVYGEADNGFAVSGFSPNNWSGYFQGSVRVVGTLVKSAGAFRIDHPLDPARKYLQHSFVESPDMKNVYDGNVVTNGKGFATVKLPAYFQALNKDFRYQLTVIAKPGQFVQAMIVKEIAHNRFTLQTSKPNVKVSWQVTGIRHDAYANAHRIQTVVPKTGSAEGKYVHPELYGKPLSKSVVVLPGMTRATKPKLSAPPTSTQR